MQSQNIVKADVIVFSTAYFQAYFVTNFKLITNYALTYINKKLFFLEIRQILHFNFSC